MFGEGDDEEAREYFPGVNRGISSSGSGSRERSSPISSPLPGTRLDASSSGTLTSSSRGRSREGLGSRDSDRGFSPTSNRSAISPYGSGSRSRSVSPSGVRKVEYKTPVIYTSCFAINIILISTSHSLYL